MISIIKREIKEGYLRRLTSMIIRNIQRRSTGVHSIRSKKEKKRSEGNKRTRQEDLTKGKSDYFL